MNPWLGKTAFLVGLVVFVAIRVPHDRRRKTAGFSAAPTGATERALLSGVFLGVFLLPIVAVASPVLSFADRALAAWELGTGAGCLLTGLWLFHRAHADLSLNWSPLVKLRSDHRLVTTGVYRFVRHPMYSSFLLYGIAQSLLLPNWVAGPSCLVATAILIAGRLRREESMMQERFGQAYSEYRRRTKRIVPGVW